jgi:hypothetical protein
MIRIVSLQTGTIVIIISIASIFVSPKFLYQEKTYD